MADYTLESLFALTIRDLGRLDVRRDHFREPGTLPCSQKVLLERLLQYLLSSPENFFLVHCDSREKGRNSLVHPSSKKIKPVPVFNQFTTDIGSVNGQIFVFLEAQVAFRTRL